MIIFLFIFYLLIRLYPYLLSPVPLGYDPGLYLYLWHHDLSIPWLQTVYPPLIFCLGKFFNFFISPENYLIPLSFIIAALLFFSVYLYTKNKWTLFLLSISAVQYRFWWYYYIKNILALSFIFFYLYFDSKKSRLKYFFPLLIPLLHQPTAIILFLILVFKKDFWSIFSFVLSFLFYYLPTYSLTIAPFLSGVASTFATSSGTFYTLPQALPLMLPYLPFAFYGWRQNKLITFMFSISFLIPLFGLFLSNRFIPFFDIFAIILAGCGLQNLQSKEKFKYFKIIYSCFLIFFILIFVAKNSSALIANDEFQEIKLFSSLPSNSYILVADNEYTPWIYGFSDQKTIAPGLGEYDIYWNNKEWNEFWLSGDRQTEIKLLNKLPQPLYIFLGDHQRQIKFAPQSNCFSRYSWHLYRFDCKTNQFLN